MKKITILLPEHNLSEIHWIHQDFFKHITQQFGGCTLTKKEGYYLNENKNVMTDRLIECVCVVPDEYLRWYLDLTDNLFRSINTELKRTRQTPEECFYREYCDVNVEFVEV